MAWLRSYQGKTPRLGARVFLAETAVVVGDVVIGDDSSIWYHSVVRGDVHSIAIGARCNVQDNCTLHVMNQEWPLVLEDEVTIGHGVTLHGCTVRRGALVGMAATVLNGCVVGEGALIAAGSLLVEGTQVPPRALFMGVPARFRRLLTGEESEDQRKYSKRYVEYKDTYLREPAAEFRG